MYIISNNDDLGLFPELYLGWQKPVWDEDGYFWTSKGTISKILEAGNNIEDHLFIFNTLGQAQSLAEHLELINYVITEWK